MGSCTVRYRYEDAYMAFSHEVYAVQGQDTDLHQKHITNTNQNISAEKSFSQQYLVFLSQGKRFGLGVPLAGESAAS